MGGRLIPRSFSKQAWHRFDQDRRRLYLDDLGGLPSHSQACRIDALIRLEWLANKYEAQGTLQADREAREHRRLLERLRADWERSLAKPPAVEATPNLTEHLARRAAREGSPA
jgi:hypothetical protein